MRRPHRLARLAGTAALAISVAACQSAREQEAQVKPEVAHAYLEDKPAPLKRHFMVALAQGQRNRVLNDMRLGLATMEMGQTTLAEQLFDDALGQIETVYADNPEASKARGLFTAELTKDFKGEPYERAMAYYYRGLLYLKGGDYDNARASFKGGFLQDSFAEEDQNRADFGLLQFLQGWASRCRGNTVTAEDDFKEFRAINADFPLPGKDDNTLVVAETGSAPIKYGVAETASDVPRFLKMRRASATESARLTVTDKLSRQVQMPLLENIYFQAATRGGRQFDSVLAGKAQFKSATDTVGNAALIGAAAATAVAANQQNKERQRDTAIAAATLLLVGLAAKSVAAATEAEADTRYWDNLPDRVHAITLPLPDSVGSLSVDFLANDGSVRRTREVTVTRAGPCGIAWVRGDSAMPGNPRAPYSAPKDTMYQPVVIPPKPAETGSALPADKPAEYAPKPDRTPNS